jgi:putative NIF3 family GTP cyclohydrolase 1 type 2
MSARILQGAEMKAREIAAVLEAIAPVDSGVPGDQLGFVWGDPETEVDALGCAWCIHADSLRRCAQRDLRMVICHEGLWLPSQSSPWYEGPDEAHIRPNQTRRRLLEEYRMVVYRSHSNWDALRGDGIADSAVACLRLDGMKEISRQKFFSVQALLAPMTVQHLRDKVASAVGYAGCRVFGDSAKRINRFAFLIGGFGENQFNMPQAAMEMGAEAIIIGEMSEFIVMGSLEMGMPVIESLHSVSEIPGIRNQARVLAARLPGVRVEYVPSGAMSFSLPDSTP